MNPLIRRTAVAASFGWLLLAAVGCSLIKIDIESEPLSEREMSTRLLTFEYASRVSREVEAVADTIIAANPFTDLEMNALRWKISATLGSRAASFHANPTIAMIDTWVFVAQMEAYFKNGAGQHDFGDWQPDVVEVCERLRSSAETGARSLSTQEEYDALTEFVSTYVDAHPLGDLTFSRDTSTIMWAQYTGVPDSALVTTSGTIPQAVADLSNRMSMFGEQMPKLVEWQSELRFRELGLDQLDFSGAMQTLDERFDRVARIAEESPERLGEAIQGLREEIEPLLLSLDARWVMSLELLTAEREALADMVESERTIIIESLDGIVTSAVDQAFGQVRKTMRLLIAGAIVLLVILFGLPFLLGFVIGRQRGRASLS